ncbi:MAG: OmpH family outer membrane protein [Roseovarius pacificus]|nr:OmpH family outer membrane protein [Roseovarius pacificus]
MTCCGLAVVRRVLVALSLLCAAVPGAVAQDMGVIESDILVIDPDRLFAETQLGLRMTSTLRAEREALIARNRELEAQLEAEEKALTDLRAQTSPEEFRKLADTFDSKVQEIRSQSERRARDLERNSSQATVQFMRLIEPVLVQIMREAGAAVVMDSRNVLLRAGAIDITDLAITRIDERIGDAMPGDAPPQDSTPMPDTPEQGPEEDPPAQDAPAEQAPAGD